MTAVLDQYWNFILLVFVSGYFFRFCVGVDEMSPNVSIEVREAENIRFLSQVFGAILNERRVELGLEEISTSKRNNQFVMNRRNWNTG